jgi:hypothetical protein
MKMNQHEPIFFTPPSDQPDRSRRLHKGGGGSSPPDYQAQAEQRRRVQRDAFYCGVGYNDPGQQSAREAQYKKIYDDVFAYHKALLDKEYEGAQRNQRFNLARTGQTGGSQDVYEQGRTSEEYNRGLGNIASQAEQAVAKSRVAYEDAVSRGLALINSGSDAGSTVANTLNMFSSALQDALESAKSGSWNNFFNNVASTVQNTQFNEGSLLAARATTQWPEDEGVKAIGGGKSSGSGRIFTNR